MDKTCVVCKRYMEENAEEIDKQWEIFRERFLVPYEIHLTEKHCIKKGAKNMNEAWKNFSKKCIESYDALQTLNGNGLMTEEEKTIHEHNLLIEILSIMKTEVDTPEKVVE